jgi:hypothetical protein
MSFKASDASSSNFDLSWGRLSSTDESPINSYILVYVSFISYCFYLGFNKITSSAKRKKRNKIRKFFDLLPIHRLYYTRLSNFARSIYSHTYSHWFLMSHTVNHDPIAI